MPTPRVQYNKVFEMAKHLEKPLFVHIFLKIFHSHPIGNQIRESSSKIAASELHYNREKIGVTHEASQT
jgi:hypothetical protein